MSLLKVTINNTVLDPPKSSEMGFEFLSSAINDEFIAGSGSFDIAFPDTANNRIAFDYANRMDAQAGLKKYPCKVEDQADGMFVGEVILWNVKGDFNTTIEQTSVRSSIEGVKIAELNFTDIDIGPDVSDVIDYANSTEDGGDFAVCFPMMHAPDFYGDDYPDWTEKTINNYDLGNATYRDNYDPDPAGIKYPLVPMVTFNHILKQIALDNDLSLAGNGMDMVELKQAFFLNNFSLDKYGESHLVHHEYASLDISTTTELLTLDYTPQTLGTHRLIFKATPSGWATSPTDIVTIGIASWGGSSWDFLVSEQMTAGVDADIVLDYDVTSLVVDLQVIARFVQTTAPNTITDVSVDFFNHANQFANEFSKTIHIANHLPDVLVSAFLANIKTLFGLKIDFDDKLGTLNINKRADLLTADQIEVEPLNTDDVKIEFQDNNGYSYQWEDGKDPFEFDGDDLGEFDDVSDLPTADDVNQYAFVLRTNAWYKVEYDEDTDDYSWEYKQFDVGSVEIGEGEITDVTVIGSPIAMEQNYAAFYVPLLPGPAHTQLFSKFDKMTDVYIGIFRGLVASGGFFYPFANSTPHNRNTFDTYDFGLTLTRNNNLFDELHRAWYEAKLDSDTITFDIDGRAIHVSEYFSKRLYWEGILMILEELTLSYSDKKQTKGRVKALKINY